MPLPNLIVIDVTGIGSGSDACSIAVYVKEFLSCNKLFIYLILILQSITKYFIVSNSDGSFLVILKASLLLISKARIKQ